jgi:hypothetical protein
LWELTPQDGGNHLKNVLIKTTILTLTLAFALSGSLTAFGFIAPGNTATFDANWRLTIDGAVNTPLSLSMSDLQAMGQTPVSGTIYCEGILVADGAWIGVQIETLLQAAGVAPTATNLEFYASDGYNINVSTSYALVNNPIIAYEYNGQPMSDDLRLVLPDQAGNFWISLITEIRVTYSDTYSLGPVGSGGGGPQPLPTASPQPVTTPPPAVSTPTPPPITVQPVQTTPPTQAPAPNDTTPQVTPNQTTAPTQSVTPQQSSTPTNSDNQSLPSATIPPVGTQQVKPVVSSGSGSLLSLELLAILALVAAGAGTAGLVVFVRRKHMKLV